MYPLENKTIFCPNSVGTVKIEECGLKPVMMRIYHCDRCGHHIDYDFNRKKNIKIRNAE